MANNLTIVQTGRHRPVGTLGDLLRFGRRISLALLCVACFGFAANAKAAPRSSSEVVRMVHYIDQRLASQGLASSPLRREMTGIVRASQASGISPFFLLAIAGTESTMGKAACGHNAWGWNSCQGSNFASFTQGAKTVAASLRANYLARGLTTLERVARKYCPPGSAQWAASIRYFMSSVFAAGEGLSWKEALAATK